MKQGLTLGKARKDREYSDLMDKSWFTAAREPNHYKPDNNANTM